MRADLRRQLGQSTVYLDPIQANIIHLDKYRFLGWLAGVNFVPVSLFWPWNTMALANLCKPNVGNSEVGGYIAKGL